MKGNQIARSTRSMKGWVGVSRVADLANLRPRVSGFTFKSCGFSVCMVCVAGCGFGHLLCSGFGNFTLNFYFVGFSKSYSPCS